MIDQKDLAKLLVHKIVFHDVPNNRKGGSAKPTLSDTETASDAKRVAMLRTRLVQVFGSGSAFAVDIQPSTASPIPKCVQTLSVASPPSNEFIERSREMAIHLFSLQAGAMSPGLLCVLTVSCGSRFGVAVMKLEREEGADLRLLQQGGHTSFEMSVLDSLVLTDGTRLFKSALFLKRGTDFDAMACDSQANPMRRTDVADFWLRFLGCQFVIDPKISTQQWFDATVEYINGHVESPVDKQQLYGHLVSELNSQRQMVAPKKFIQDYVLKDLKQPYADFLSSKGVPLQQFHKDASEIESKLKRLAYHTSEGITVTVPEDKKGLIEVGKKQIVVRDSLNSISRK